MTRSLLHGRYCNGFAFGVVEPVHGAYVHDHGQSIHDHQGNYEGDQKSGQNGDRGESHTVVRVAEGRVLGANLHLEILESEGHVLFLLREHGLGAVVAESFGIEYRRVQGHLSALVINDAFEVPVTTFIVKVHQNVELFRLLVLDANLSLPFTDCNRCSRRLAQSFDFFLIFLQNKSD